MNISLMKDGNFSFFAVVILAIIGVALMAAGVLFEGIPRHFKIVMILAGFLMIVTGGYASRARMFGLKPFDNSYKKARDSYQNNETEGQGKVDD
jgi:hypothetical protein